MSCLLHDHPLHRIASALSWPCQSSNLPSPFLLHAIVQAHTCDVICPLTPEPESLHSTSTDSLACTLTLPRQIKLYDLCLRHASPLHAFIAFIDVDEFLVMASAERARGLPGLLKEFEQHGALAVNWRLLGSGGQWLGYWMGTEACGGGQVCAVSEGVFPSRKQVDGFEAKRLAGSHGFHCTHPIVHRVSWSGLHAQTCTDFEQCLACCGRTTTQISAPQTHMHSLQAMPSSQGAESCRTSWHARQYNTLRIDMCV